MVCLDLEDHRVLVELLGVPGPLVLRVRLGSQDPRDPLGHQDSPVYQECLDQLVLQDHLDP